MKPLVSIITPTWNRHEKLLNRCIPSVQAQTYGRIEHVIVSDGPDPELRDKLAQMAEDKTFYYAVRYAQLPYHTGLWGSVPRHAGIQVAGGAYIGYIDDDDALRPDHVKVLAGALSNSEAGFAYSLMESHSNSGLSTHIGTDPPVCGQIGTPMLMHRREILEYGTWGPPSTTEDWELVSRWLDAGIPYAFLQEATVDVWPSAYWG